ncbi:hypothetical protein JRO89_XS02G0021200 [Xanthoceras sorbifolium]|uniref:AIG1-type G domain-containing protein n=1 Tax=Xanthoceras sorbifolium TaxID=99658 RepID=A0ABQ8IEI0_9ROSI|nr:hypothetical protein JRO89_XS02G0021200 [Xanthoceras sorbifolium]
MENGNGVDRTVEDKALENKVEEKVLVGSVGLKDTEEEVFEEAVDTHDHSHEQGTETESGNGDHIVGDSDSVMVDESSNLGGEMESFEEAVEGLIEVGNAVGEDKVEGLVDVDRVDGVVVPDKIDEGGTMRELVTGDFDKETEVSEADDMGKNAVLKLGIESPENGNSADVNVPESIVDAKLENGNASMVGEDREIGSSGGVLPKYGSEEFREREFGAEYRNDKAVELVEASVGIPLEPLDDKGEELNDNLASVNTEQAEKGSEELKEATLVLSLENGHNMDEEVSDNLPKFETEHWNDQNGETKDTLAGLDSEPSKETHELEGTLAGLHEAVVEGTVTQEVGSSPSLEKPANEKNENVQIGTSDMRAESEPEHADETVHEIHVVAKGPERKEEKELEENQITQVISEGPEKKEEVQEEKQSTQVISEGPEKKEEKELEENQITQVISEGPEKKEEEVQEEKQSTQVISEGPEKKEEKVQEEKPITQVISEGPEKEEEKVQEEKPITQVISEGPEKKEEKEQEVKQITQVISEGPEKKEGKIQEEKQSTQVVRERKIKPALDLASSAARSSNPGTPARPAGLGRAAPLLEPAPRVVQHPRVNGTVSHTQTQQIEDSGNSETEEYDETREKLQMIRVKFLRLAHRLGQTPHNVVVAQVLYRLGLAEQLRGGNGGRVGAFSFDRASAMAEQLEAAGQEPLDFSCTIMVLGKTGVGKSATINSIFDEVKFGTDAFQMGTKKVQDVVGTVQGIKVRVIDTPGLLPSWSDQRQNEKILHSVKRFIKKTPPDIVLYLDRLDMQSRDFGDMPLLRTITEIFGPSIWFNAIVVLTHAASAPPDGPNGTASSYDMFVTQRSHVVQQAIRQAAGDMRLMNPVSLVENHSACRTNRAGQRVLPNGQVWKPHLLLLSFASKILAEANTLLKLQDSPPGKPFTARSRAPPLPFLLSSLLQSRPQVKLPEEQFGDEDGLDDDLDDSSESEDESELDELPPFKRLTKAQMSKLTKAQKKAYFDELEYREKLFMKKQLKEEKRRQKIMKKMAAAAKDLPSDYSENVEEESNAAASVPVPMPDLALPASFDSDNPTHRYRYLDSSNQWLVRPVLETHGWDHDVGYEGINAEKLFVVKDKIPISFSGQISKDKKDANVQMELASSLKHGEGKATSFGFDMQTVGKDLAYTLRSETRFSNFRRNKATAGLSVTHLADSISAGVKIEDKLIVKKRFRVVMTGGAMTGRSDVAYGGSLEAQLRDKDYPLGRSLSTLGLSVMDWHGDLAIGCNIQSQVPIGRSTNLIARANLNNRGAGQVSVRLNSSEQLQIALVGLIPLLKKLFIHPQQMQFGQ